MWDRDAAGSEAGGQKTLVDAFLEEAHDLDGARASVADAASVASRLWLTYLGVLVYIAIAAGAVTHEDLFLERPVKLPFVGDVPLPLEAFYFLAPVVFVIWHAYTLLHFEILAAKVRMFEERVKAAVSTFAEQRVAKTRASDEQAAGKVHALDRHVENPGVNAAESAALEGVHRIRWQLPADLFVQLLAAPELRRGRIGVVSKLIARLSLVVGPILLLLLIQIQFLPFHSEFITWVHRILIFLDLVLLWLFWPAVAAEGKEIWSLRRGRRVLLVASLAALFLSFLLARFPGEWMDGALDFKWIPPNRLTASLGARNEQEQPIPTSLHDLLFSGPYDERSQRRRSLFSNTLVLPGFDASAARLGAPAIARKQGHFEKAIFRGADLRKVNFENAHLEGASFYQAHLEEASLYNAKLQRADFYQAHLNKASFSDAALGFANFQGADLERANFYGAGLQGASLEQAKLTEVDLRRAKLQAATFYKADANRAILEDADLRAANFRGARLQVAMFKRAQLEGASLMETQLEEADFSDSKLDFARLDYASVSKTVFGGADLNKVIAAQSKPSPNPLPGKAKMSQEDTALWRQALADQLQRFVCQLRDEEVSSVVNGLIRDNHADSIIRNASDQAGGLIRRILDPNCPASTYMTSEDKAALKAFADKLEGAGAPP